MVRLFLYFLGLAGLTAFLAWLADQPGTMVITLADREIQTSVFFAVCGLIVLAAVTVLAWSLLRGLISAPGAVSRFSLRRRQKQGMEALTSGLLAVGAGDKAQATRYALQAARTLPNEPLTDLLRAQTAQLLGDRSTARRIYEAMLNSPETELLGLRGLYLEAEREKEQTAQVQFAQRALARNPKLGWAHSALFDVQCQRQDWAGALETLVAGRRHDLVPKKIAERRRAVLLTAQAQSLEESQPDKAATLASEAHDLAPDFVPAAEIAARIHASRGRMQKAATIIEQTWKRGPHPDLALVYAHARTGDSPKDRLARVQKLAALAPQHRESLLAVASAAIEAREWDVARDAVKPLLDGDVTQRLCVLMARIEGGDRGDTGRVREWLARAVHAPRDPSWVADGQTAERWQAVSSTGKLDAFRWSAEDVRPVGADQRLLLEELAAAGDRGVANQIAEQIAKVTADIKAEAMAAAKAEVAAQTAQGKPPVANAPDSRREAAVLQITALPNPANDASKRAAAPETKAAQYVLSGHAPDDPGPDSKAAATN